MNQLTTWLLLSIAALTFTACDPATPVDTNNTSAPKVNIYLDLSPSELAINKGRWGSIYNDKGLWSSSGKTTPEAVWKIDQRYANVLPAPESNRELSFVVTVEDPGGVEQIDIKVCPPGAVQKWLEGGPSNSEDPNAGIQTRYSGILKRMPRNTPISIVVTAKDKSRGGKPQQTSVCAVYTIGSSTREVYSTDFPGNEASTKHPDFCKPFKRLRAATIISANKFGGAGSTLCGCLDNGTGVCNSTAGSCQPNTDTELPADFKPVKFKIIYGGSPIPGQPAPKFTLAPPGSLPIPGVFEADKVHPLNYSGPVLGSWSIGAPVGFSSALKLELME